MRPATLTILSLAHVLAGCPATDPAPSPGPSSAASAPAASGSAASAASPSGGPVVQIAVRKPISGTLEIWSDGMQIGYEKYEDDGTTLRETVALAGRPSELIYTRTPTRHVKADKYEQDVSPLVFPSWKGATAFGQRYSLAAEWFGAGPTETAFDLVDPPKWEPKKGGTVTVTAVDGGAFRVVVGAPWGAITAEVAADGRVLSWTNGEKGEKSLEGKSAPAGIDSELLELTHGDVTLRGSLWLPSGTKGPLPLLIIHAGSGPTDRDWNGPVQHLRTNAARMLALELAKKGVATFRFDKRGIMQSPFPAGYDVKTLTVQDYAGDLGFITEELRKDARFGPITVLGHSEGGLIALLAAQKTPPDSLILLNSVGRIWHELIHAQLESKISASALASYDQIVKDLRAGKTPKEIPWVLQSVLIPEQFAYFKSEMDLDPADLLAKLKIPTTVLQGETDVQTTIDDAKAVTRKRSEVQVVLLPKVNHVLKEEEKRESGQGSYDDPDEPLGPGVVDAVLAGIKR